MVFFDSGLIVAFFDNFAFSLAANSCLTLRPMASTSTLYAVAASRRTCAAFCRVAAWRMVISTNRPPSALSSARRR